MSSDGTPLNAADYQDIPCIMDVKNRDSLKSINAVMGAFKKKNMLPIMGTVKMEGVEDSIPTGAKFGKIVASMGDKVELTEADNDTLKDFIELIEYSNGKILDLYNERANKELSSSDAAMVDDILNNDYIEVE
jgi:hypothetical protein